MDPIDLGRQRWYTRQTNKYHIGNGADFKKDVTKVKVVS